MNLSMGGVYMIALVVITGVLFWRAHGLRERALAITRRYCQQQHVMLLDESVGLQKLRLKKTAPRQWRLVRTYGFEFTVSGAERYQGHITLISGYAPAIYLPPHRFSSPPEENQ